MLKVVDDNGKILGVLGANTFAYEVNAGSNKVVLDLDFSTSLKE